MRLIDADDLRRVFDECVWNSAISEVDDAPTAYDVKAVIEELEHNVKYYSDSNVWTLAVPINVAIEIVKRGGIK